MFPTTDHDMMIFVWRFIILCFTVVLLFVAARMTMNNIGRARYRNNKRRLRVRLVISCCVILLGAATGIFSIWELCSNNSNEWLGMKISFYIFAWNFAISIGVFWDSEYYDEDRLLKEKITNIGKMVGLVSILAIVANVGFFIYGGSVYTLSSNKILVEREIVSSTELIAANDGQQIKGKLTSGLFTTAFTISENGAYRYYYKDKNGGIKQGCVDANETTIYYTENDETPHLDCLTSYTYSVHMRNNKTWENRQNEETWYELYVPEGSVVEAYVFDLQ